jgi:hypothetical protein
MIRRRSLATALTWLLVLSGGCVASQPARAWADEGHQIIGEMAAHLMAPGTLARVQSILATDDSALTADTGIANEANWADRYRESDRRASRQRFEGTTNWHFVDIEIDNPDIDAACFGFPKLGDVPASAGPAQDCIVNKIMQFTAELHAAQTTPSERLRALQFLLHLIGDLHQPLHASDDHDRGGNEKRVISPAPRRADLHFYWDTWLVQQLGADYADVAAMLLARLPAAQRRAWASGTPRDWAQESFVIGKAQVYGRLPPPAADGTYSLDAQYLEPSVDVVRTQLAKAAVRLAMTLDQALAAQ